MSDLEIKIEKSIQDLEEQIDSLDDITKELYFVELVIKTFRDKKIILEIKTQGI